MSQPPFGLVPAGQPVIVTPTETPSPTSFLYAIPPAVPAPVSPGVPPVAADAAAATAVVPGKSFSHLVVFLLPGIVLPPGTAAAIYLVTPPPAAPLPQQHQAIPALRFLGGIGPGKESAIFKLRGPQQQQQQQSMGGLPVGGVEQPVVIGISIEPAESVAARIEQPQQASDTSVALVPAAAGRQQQHGQQKTSTLVLAQRIIKNAFNFLASFSGNAGEVEVVPLKAFEDWWRKFEGKVRADPSFLERDEI